MTLEVCLDSVESAVAAERGGADRIELCSALHQGGLTPSAGLITAVRREVSLDLFVMVRPRGGDFVYSEVELEVMLEDIRVAKALGVDGVVLGVLTADGRVDGAHTRQLIECARPLPVTFHRAFDLSVDLDAALEEVIACAADRLLTSGGEPDAVSGIAALARLNAAAGKRISIMAGAGIRQTNVEQIIHATGVREIHTTLGTRTSASATHPRAQVKMGAEDESSRYVIVEQEVRRFRSTLDAMGIAKVEEAR